MVIFLAFSFYPNGTEIPSKIQPNRSIQDRITIKSLLQSIIQPDAINKGVHAARKLRNLRGLFVR